MVEIKHFINVKAYRENGLEELYRKKNPDFSVFTRSNRSSGKRCTLGRVYTDIKTTSNTKINHVMVSFTNYFNDNFIDILHS